MHFLTTIVLIALLSLCTAQTATNKGYYHQTWKTGSNVIPSDTTIGIAFNGFINPDTAISESNAAKSKLLGAKWLSLGGGNDNGKWTPGSIDSINTRINDNTFKNAGYAGLCYDIEYADRGSLANYAALGDKFLASFSAAKAKGLKVMVTISHSAPYTMSVTDAAALMNKIIPSSNVDFWTPQLYASGSEASLDYSTAASYPWSSWKNIASNSKILLSIPFSSQWLCGQKYFTSTLGFTASQITGYIVWNNETPVGSANCGGSSTGTARTTRCGRDWTEANGKCGKKCITNAECTGLLDGASCWANLASISGCVDTAVEETSAMSSNSLGMSPTVIGLSAALVVVGLALIVVSVFLYKKSVVKREEIA